MNSKKSVLTSCVSAELIQAYEKKNGVNLLELERVRQESSRKINQFDKLLKVSGALSLLAYIIFMICAVKYSASDRAMLASLATVTILASWIILGSILVLLMCKHQKIHEGASSQLNEFWEVTNLFRAYELDGLFLTKELAEENVRDLARQIVVGGEFLQRLEAKGVTTFDFGIQNQINVARDRMNTATARASKIGLEFDRRSMLQSVHDQMINAEKAAAAKV